MKIHLHNKTPRRDPAARSTRPANTPTHPPPNTPAVPQVDYYISQSKANNHAVREAACACIAELMEKVSPAAVGPHVPALLRALLLCFKDTSWPVRDAACVACGRCAGPAGASACGVPATRLIPPSPAEPL